METEHAAADEADVRARSPRSLLVRAEFDAPGETTRQGKVLLIWLLCLLAAVVLVVARRPSSHASVDRCGGHAAAQQRWRQERLAIAAGVGVLLPGLWTWWLTYRRRRGGPHARGIRVEVTTGDGELRIWGRGYGQRVSLAGARCSERLVDVFTGRTGVWRQRRLRIRAPRPLAGHGSEIEIATVANVADEALGLRLDGGEGDCIELSRANYQAVLRALRAALEDEQA